MPSDWNFTHCCQWTATLCFWPPLTITSAIWLDTSITTATDDQPVLSARFTKIMTLKNHCQLMLTTNHSHTEWIHIQYNTTFGTTNTCNDHQCLTIIIRKSESEVLMMVIHHFDVSAPMFHAKGFKMPHSEAHLQTIHLTS